MPCCSLPLEFLERNVTSGLELASVVGVCASIAIPHRSHMYPPHKVGQPEQQQTKDLHACPPMHMHAPGGRYCVIEVPGLHACTGALLTVIGILYWQGGFFHGKDTHCLGDR